MKISIGSTVVIALAMAAISHEVESTLPTITPLPINELSQIDQKILGAFKLSNRNDVGNSFATTQPALPSPPPGHNGPQPGHLDAAKERVKNLTIDVGPGKLDFLTASQVSGFQQDLTTKAARCVARDIWTTLESYKPAKVPKTIDEVIEIAKRYANDQAAPKHGVSQFMADLGSWGYLTSHKSSHLKQTVDDGVDSPQEVAEEALGILQRYKETTDTFSVDQEIQKAQEYEIDPGVTAEQVKALANRAKVEGYLENDVAQGFLQTLASGVDTPQLVAGDIKIALENYKNNLQPCP